LRVPRSGALKPVEQAAGLDGGGRWQNRRRVTAKAQSAGVLLYRIRDGRPEVLLGHMGGPFWARKDDAAWSVFKGEHTADEEPLAAARREFEEETGSRPPEGPALDLGEVRQSSGKRVTAWAMEGDFDPGELRSNTFTVEWPPRSGRQAEFPEIDRAAWFDLDTARRKIVRAQAAFIDRLERALGVGG
jgi:predicted NUDIX family NTP pyrophosphohydrolase